MRRTRLYSINSGPATGGAGTASSSGISTEVIRGEIMSISVKYNDSPPGATTDVTIAGNGTDGPPAQTILTLSNQATDKIVYPRIQVQDQVGANITGEYTPIMVHDRIKVTIAQANDNDHVDVWLTVRD